MDEQRQKTDWRSIYSLAVITFLMSLQMGTVNINLWAYITELDTTITSTFFGYMLSFSSICNVLATFLAGYTANLISHTSPALIIGKISTIIGCLIFLCVEVFSTQRRVLFIIMQGFFGASIGLVSVMRAQISSASMEQDRSKAISLHGFGTTVGVALGPLLMVVMTMLKYPGFDFLFGLHLNMFTMPSYFVILCSFGAILLIIFCYNGQLNEAPIIVSKELKEKLKSGTSYSYDSLAIGICCLTKVSSGLSMIFMTSVNGVYIMQAFRWTSSKYVLYSAIMNGISGASGVIFSLFYFFGVLQKWISPRQGVIISVASHTIFFLLNYPWWFLSSRMEYAILGVNEQNQSIILDPGCRQEQEWCIDMPAINPYLYCISHVICLSISLPLMMLNIDILFSKILGPIKQGTQFGIFLVCGEVLNIMCPIVMTQIYEQNGPQYIWMFLIGVHMLIMLAWAIFYSRMIPYSQMVKEKYKKDSITAVEPFEGVKN